MMRQNGTKTDQVKPTKGDVQGRKFQPRLDWVASYPKSGNTWTRLVSRVYSYGRPDLDKLGRAGDLQMNIYHNVSPLPVSQLGLMAEVQLRPAAMLQLAVNMHPKTHLIKSHNACIAYQGVDLFHPQWTDTVINVVRDPRDIAPSLAEHFGLELEEAVEFMGEEKVIGSDEGLHHFLATWSKHVQSWLTATEQDVWDVHVVRYEDMQEAPIEAFGGVMEAVLGHEPDEKRLRDAVETCEFDRLQEIEEEHGFPEQSNEADRFFRRGESGAWRDELPGPLARKIEDEHGRMMEELDYI